MLELSVLGVGPYTAVVIELANICGYKVSSLYHYDSSRNNEIFHGVKIVGSFEDLMISDLEDLNFSLSMGSSDVRSKLFNDIRSKGGFFPSLIHPQVEISPSASVGEGVILKRNVAIQACAKIANNVIICDNTLICHHSQIDEGTFIAGGVVVGAYTHIENEVFIGQNATIPSGKVKSVGSRSVIGAGSVVVRNVLKNEVVAGVPAKSINK